MSNPAFWVKIRKKYFKISFAEYARRVAKVNKCHSHKMMVTMRMFWPFPALQEYFGEVIFVR